MAKPEGLKPIDYYLFEREFDQLKKQNALILCGIDDVKKQTTLILSKLGGGMIIPELEKQINIALGLSRAIDRKVPDEKTNQN